MLKRTSFTENGSNLLDPHAHARAYQKWLADFQIIVAFEPTLRFEHVRIGEVLWVVCY
jgi:hypothetical protein